MQSILHGARAGVLSGLVLTIWCVLAVNGASEGGAAFVASAFGLLTLPQIGYGIAIGLVVALWMVVFDRFDLLPLHEALGDATTDRRLAAGLATLPLAAATVAAGVMGVHLGVTSGFARDGFQAQGLAMAAGVLSVTAVAAAPAIYGAFQWLFRTIKAEPTRPMWTWLVAGLYGFGIGACIIFAYIHAQGLYVWSTAQIQMTLASVVLTPVLMGGMHWWTVDRRAWRWGVPTAGAALALICFVGASSWATATADLRALTFRDAPVVSSLASAVIDVTDDHGDIYATDLCDDEDGTCDDGAEPVGLDSPEHPARVAVDRATRVADRAQQNEFEDIPDPPKNVVFVMIDTLRHDHMGYAGYERDTTPNIDAIAEDAVVFHDAYATSPHTPRTIPPIFFSRYASNMQWILPDTNFPRVRPENLSMYEVKQDEGWQTISKTSHFYFRERRGLHQGFDIWDNEGAKSLEDSHDDIATPRIWERLRPRLEKLGEEHRTKGVDARPFSLFVHFFDPHARYNHHDEFSFDRGDTNHERLIADYDSEIAHADHYVGKIVDTLKEQDLYDDVIFVITSDHGEAFDEHGYYFHGQTLYNTVLNVPKLIRVPGWFSQEVEGQVSVIDIAPTLFDLIGLAIPDEFEGEVLTDAMLGRQDVPDRPVFGELLPYTALDEHHRAVVYDDQKLIVDFSLDIEEFYDLSDDPEEQHNLIDQRSDDAAKLRDMLDEFMQ